MQCLKLFRSVCPAYANAVIISGYRILGSRFRTSEIPDNILEAIARTMLPDIREFFLSKEGQEEYAAWKAEYEKNKKKRA